MTREEVAQIIHEEMNSLVDTPDMVSSFERCKDAAAVRIASAPASDAAGEELAALKALLGEATTELEGNSLVFSRCANLITDLRAANRRLAQTNAELRAKVEAALSEIRECESRRMDDEKARIAKNMLVIVRAALAATHAPAAGQSEPAWTSTPPTTPGHYWWRQIPAGESVMVSVERACHTGDMVCRIKTADWDCAANYGGEWQGPITPRAD